jgi:hypothetical protein
VAKRDHIPSRRTGKTPLGAKVFSYYTQEERRLLEKAAKQERRSLSSFVCPRLSSDARHSQTRSTQCLRRIGTASRKQDGQSCADGTRRNCSAQRADAHNQYSHFEASKMGYARIFPSPTTTASPPT